MFRNFIYCSYLRNRVKLVQIWSSPCVDGNFGHVLVWLHQACILWPETFTKSKRNISIMKEVVHSLTYLITRAWSYIPCFNSALEWSKRWGWRGFRGTRCDCWRWGDTRWVLESILFFTFSFFIFLFFFIDSIHHSQLWPTSHSSSFWSLSFTLLMKSTPFKPFCCNPCNGIKVCGGC